MQKKNALEGYCTLQEIAAYGHVTRQAIHMLLKKGLCPAFKHEGAWQIKISDYDEYRANRYNKDKRKYRGQRVYDVDKGLYTVRQVATVFSSSLGRKYSIHKIYYQLRSGKLPSKRVGAAWVIEKKHAIALLEKEQEKRGIAHE